MLDKTDPEFLQYIRDHTRILRKPYTGIVSGYHKLPYILIGPDGDNDKKSVEVKGKIHVSPKLIFTPNPDHPTFEQLFEKEYMNEKLSGRIFSFFYTNRYSNVNIQNEDLKIERRAHQAKDQESHVMDDILKKEIIDTAVIGCPNIEFYPISLERFIVEILDREFK
jgi:hypothetical protein